MPFHLTCYEITFCFGVYVLALFYGLYDSYRFGTGEWLQQLFPLIVFVVVELIFDFVFNNFRITTMGIAKGIGIQSRRCGRIQLGDIQTTRWRQSVLADHTCIEFRTVSHRLADGKRFSLSLALSLFLIYFWKSFPVLPESAIDPCMRRHHIHRL